MKPSAEMTCDELAERATSYLEGALPLPQRDRFEIHHQRCSRCQAHVAQVRLLVSTLGQLRPSQGGELSAEQRRMLEIFRTRGLHSGRTRDRDIPLGLGSEHAALGDHIAYFIESERELDATAGFLAAGASLGEACVLIGHDAANQHLLASLERRGLSVAALRQDGQLQVALVPSSADELLLEIDGRIKDAVHRGMPAVRILGTLNWGRGSAGWPSDPEILRLEAHVTSAGQRLPSIVVCTYDVNSLPGPLLVKGGLECHPLTFRRGRLRHNEHHVPSEQFLAEL
ncbi:MAG TPA: MEDS domain-containing protein [Methylomirabilota bacterium]|nr:MEDS domain-containing protein [Methylomirabilota bacterium]